MAALPYIQLYAADYLADTTHLTLKEHGAYLLLILNYWQRGVPPMDDPARLTAICRCTYDEWDELGCVLSEFFDIRDGHWHHNRIDQDLAQVNRQQNQRIAAGKASANSRKRKVIPTVVQRMERSTNKDTDTDTDTDTDKIKTKGRFTPPSVQEVKDYCQSRNNNIDPETFVDHYEANGWMRGSNKIKCWKACVRTWEKSPRQQKAAKLNQIGQRSYERLQQALQGSGNQGNSDDQQYVPQLTIGKEDGKC